MPLFIMTLLLGYIWLGLNVYESIAFAVLYVVAYPMAAFLWTIFMCTVWLVIEGTIRLTKRFIKRG